MQNPSPVIKNYIESPDIFVLDKQTTGSCLSITDFTRTLTPKESRLFIIFIFGILFFKENLITERIVQ